MRFVTDRMYSEDELLPISALQHLLFCERQAALIHVERLWRDNSLTLEGSHLHRRVDETAPRREVRGDVAILRGVTLRSLRLGLAGRADVVELRRRNIDAHGKRGSELPSAVPFDRLSGTWTPFPIDYKRGKPKTERCDEVQLCAQALCLEEMLGVSVLHGALFFGKEQRRHPVSFDIELRRLTENAARRLHEIVCNGETPRAVKTPGCKRCSLVDICLPDVTGPRRSVHRYVRAAVAQVVNPVGQEP